MKKSKIKKSSKRKSPASRGKSAGNYLEKIGTGCPLCGHCHKSWICK